MRSEIHIISATDDSHGQYADRDRKVSVDELEATLDAMIKHERRSEFEGYTYPQLVELKGEFHLLMDKLVKEYGCDLLR